MMDAQEGVASAKELREDLEGAQMEAVSSLLF